MPARPALASLLLTLTAALAPNASAQPVGPAVVLPNPFPSGVVVVLQHTDTTVNDLILSRAGYKIVEPSTTGLRSGDLTPNQVARMKVDGVSRCRSLVLAYLSIGEAEDYRDYWNPQWVDASGVPISGVAPAWLGPENPEWEGNYKVRYWRQGWQRLLLGTPSGPDKTPLDRIIDQGFDGVYLDIVDAFEYWSLDNPELSRRDARLRMILLIEKIADYARNTRGQTQFHLFIQNGVELILDDNGQPDDLRDRLSLAITGVGLEDVFYDGIRRQPQQHTDHVLATTYQIFSNRLYPASLPFTFTPVLAIDYVIRGRNENLASNRARAAAFYELARNNNLLPYAARTNRELDEILTLAGPRWTIIQPDETCNLCDICLADFTGAALTTAAANPNQRQPDGVVDIDDFRAFMNAYASAHPLADITGSSRPGDPAYAVPDARVTTDDFILFMEMYSRANPR